MRGIQMGAALGARVLSDPTDEDMAWADVVVLVKKYAVEYAAHVHRAGKPIIWDALDFWMQPGQNHLDLSSGIRAFHQMKALIKPTAVICATEQMVRDCGGVYIPHHCRLGLVATPPRERVQTVAYDGGERYLGLWDVAIRDECHRRGWDFVVNPKHLAEADILVAFRDGQWDGPLCRAWKSGVKYVNAKRAGRPIITQPCAAVDELLPMRFEVDDVRLLATAFDTMSDTFRLGASFQQSEAYTVEAIAETYYRPLLKLVASEVPCTAM